MEWYKKTLILTNPIVWPIAGGVLISVVLKNLFGGVYKDCKKIVASEMK